MDEVLTMALRVRFMVYCLYNELDGILMNALMVNAHKLIIELLRVELASAE